MQKQVLQHLTAEAIGLVLDMDDIAIILPSESYQTFLRKKEQLVTILAKINYSAYYAQKYLGEK